MMKQNSPHAYFQLAALCVFLVIGSALTAWGGTADGNDAVRLTWSQCQRIDRSEVQRILQLELQSPGTEETGTGRAAEIRIACDSESYTITVTDNSAQEALTREIPVDVEEDGGSERVLAIAGAELVLSIRERHRTADAGNDAGPDSAQRAAAPPNTRHTNATNSAQKTVNKIEAPHGDHPGQPSVGDDAAANIGVRLSGSGRLFSRGKLFLYGGEVGATLSLFGPFELEWRIGAEGGVARRHIGSASMFFASSALMVGAEGAMGAKLRMRGLAGFRGGYGRLVARPRADVVGSKLNGSLGGPVVRVSIETVTRPAFGVSFEMGYALWGVTGLVEDAKAVELKGLWFLLSLDIMRR
jgi:hypothetical protein